ncbi:MAG: response regulator transcription factor [Stellaceae bacterium]
MSYKVLFVDDSKLARMAMARVLNSLYPDWMHIDAANADEAVTLVRQAGADIALIDFNMPGRDGLSLAAELRESKPTMPVAVISANHQQEIVQRTHAVGATFLAKPLTEQSLGKFLVEAVQRLMVGTR